MKKQSKGIKRDTRKITWTLPNEKIQISESTTDRHASRRRRIHKRTSF
jgi:hypothetical protein